MSKADKMFEELGYEKFNAPEREVYYVLDEFNIIRFWKPVKKVVKQDSKGTGITINMQELQAINEKCKELGWL